MSWRLATWKVKATYMGEKPGRILALSKIYQKGQTTVPVVVRKMLNLKEKGYMAWVLEHGDVVVRRGKWTVPRT